MLSPLYTWIAKAVARLREDGSGNLKKDDS
jgi:hypothetical protein